MKTKMKIGTCYYLAILLVICPSLSSACFKIPNIIPTTTKSLTTTKKTTTIPPATTCPVLDCKNNGRFDITTCTCVCNPSWFGPCKIIVFFSKHLKSLKFSLFKCAQN